MWPWHPEVTQLTDLFYERLVGSGRGQQDNLLISVSLSANLLSGLITEAETRTIPVKIELLRGERVLSPFCFG